MVATTIVLSITPSIDNVSRFILMMLGPAVALLAFVAWLLFFSRLTWKERSGIVLAMLILAALYSFVVAADTGLVLFIYGVPLWILAVAIVLTAVRDRAPRARVFAVVIALAGTWSVFPLLRLEGFVGRYLPEFAWRWSPTPEQELLSESRLVTAPTAAPWEPTNVAWPGFRGVGRDGSAVTTCGSQNWQAGPPKLLWQRPIGPGWSSFALASNRLFSRR